MKILGDFCDLCGLIKRRPAEFRIVDEVKGIWQTGDTPNLIQPKVLCISCFENCFKKANITPGCGEESYIDPGLVGWEVIPHGPMLEPNIDAGAEDDAEMSELRKEVGALPNLSIPESIKATLPTKPTEHVTDNPLPTINVKMPVIESKYVICELCKGYGRETLRAPNYKLPELCKACDGWGKILLEGTDKPREHYDPDPTACDFTPCQCEDCLKKVAAKILKEEFEDGAGVPFELTEPPVCDRCGMKKSDHYTYADSPGEFFCDASYQPTYKPADVNSPTRKLKVEQAATMQEVATALGWQSGGKPCEEITMVGQKEDVDANGVSLKMAREAGRKSAERMESALADALTRNLENIAVAQGEQKDVAALLWERCRPDLVQPDELSRKAMLEIRRLRNEVLEHKKQLSKLWDSIPQTQVTKEPAKDDLQATLESCLQEIKDIYASTTVPLTAATLISHIWECCKPEVAELVQACMPVSQAKPVQVPTDEEIVEKTFGKPEYYKELSEHIADEASCFKNPQRTFLELAAEQIGKPGFRFVRIQASNPVPNDQEGE